PSADCRTPGRLCRDGRHGVLADRQRYPTPALQAGTALERPLLHAGKGTVVRFCTDPVTGRGFNLPVTRFSVFTERSPQALGSPLILWFQETSPLGYTCWL